MPILGPEGRIQDAVVRWVRDRFTEEQITTRKNQAGPFGARGWPDYEFYMDGGQVFMIEFKAPGEELSPLQAERVKRLRAMGFRVYVVDNAEQGKAIIANEWRKRDLGAPSVST